MKLFNVSLLVAAVMAVCGVSSLRLLENQQPRIDTSAFPETERTCGHVGALPIGGRMHEHMRCMDSKHSPLTLRAISALFSAR